MKRTFILTFTLLLVSAGMARSAPTSPTVPRNGACAMVYPSTLPASSGVSLYYERYLSSGSFLQVGFSTRFSTTHQHSIATDYYDFARDNASETISLSLLYYRRIPAGQRVTLLAGGGMQIGTGISDLKSATSRNSADAEYSTTSLTGGLVGRVGAEWAFHPRLALVVETSMYLNYQHVHQKGDASEGSEPYMRTKLTYETYSFSTGNVRAGLRFRF